MNQKIQSPMLVGKDGTGNTAEGCERCEQDEIICTAIIQGIIQLSKHLCSVELIQCADGAIDKFPKLLCVVIVVRSLIWDVYFCQVAPYRRLLMEELCMSH